MIPRNAIAGLLVILCVTLVGLAVVSGGYALAATVGDVPAARILGGVAITLLLLLPVTLVLLVIALTLNYLFELPPPASLPQRGAERTESTDEPKPVVQPRRRSG